MAERTRGVLYQPAILTASQVSIVGKIMIVSFNSSQFSSDCRIFMNKYQRQDWRQFSHSRTHLRTQRRADLPPPFCKRNYGTTVPGRQPEGFSSAAVLPWLLLTSALNG